MQQMLALVAKAGEEAFPSHVRDILAAPIVDGLVSIKPNGLIFVSHVHYRDRLDAAFGIGGWCVVPLDKPHIQGSRVLYHGFLKAAGRYIADAVGGQDYIPSNRAMNYDDAVEGAKSDCLVRCCKALPMFRECWDQDYIMYWKATYAQEVAKPGAYGGKAWRKKGEYTRNFNTKPGKESESEFSKPPRVEDEANAHLEAMRREAKAYILTSGEELQGDEFYDDGRED